MGFHQEDRTGSTKPAVRKTDYGAVYVNTNSEKKAEEVPSENAEAPQEPVSAPLTASNEEKVQSTPKGNKRGPKAKK